MTNFPKSRKTRLKNGIRVITEWLPHMRSAAVGIFICTGSYAERENEKGISHFIEHMTFKGTPTRSAKQIAEELDNIGGKINAYTAKEYTCYYAVTLDKHFDIAINVLSDILNNSLYNPQDFEREKKVILEEINMYEDSPDELVHDEFIKAILGDNPLASPILGDKKSVSSFKRPNIMDFRKRHYTPDNIIISVAGDVWHSTALAKIKPLFGRLIGKHHYPKEPLPHFKGKVVLKHKKTEQIHVCLGTRGVSQLEEERYPYIILDKILGGSMSSRLFQEIREKRGLAYSIFSSLTPFQDGGIFYVYAGASKENLEQLVDLILKEFRIIKKGEISKDEIKKTVEYIKGSLVLGLEGTSARMNYMARSEFYYGKVQTVNEILRNFDRVTKDDIIAVAETFFKNKYMTLAVVGDLKKLPFKEISL